MRAARKTAARKRSAPRYMFAKQTMLARNEMRINFLQSDRDALELITSMEALGETKLLAHVYVRLVLAQRAFGESEGVLRFAGTEQMTAWQQLVEYLRVADATARKALVWLEEQGAIGYWAGKNGAGIRIFLNRAVSSIRKRPEYLCAVGAEEKNLPESPASIEEPVRSRNEAAFRTQEAERDFKKEIETHAPANGAESISESEIATIGLSDQLATNANGRDPAPSSVPDSSKPEPQPRRWTRN